jgi:hypothetical protein
VGRLRDSRAEAGLRQNGWTSPPADPNDSGSTNTSSTHASSQSANQASVELTASPAPEPSASDDAAAATNQCPAPGWEQHFDTTGDPESAPDPGAEGDAGAPDAGG